ncbi:MAG: acetolactate synthase large subunit [Pseudomonadota bacterium]|nr:acetolactate synthase large subunit [Pseudomonadota bacterium]MDQ1309104.1 acetolactate synthase large subunit [Pseudomonadota bacterium]
MTLITGGELLARTLANEGVRFVFGLPCPEIDPFLVTLPSHGIRFVPVRHEAAAVHMAEGLYKTTGQVAVVLGNPGPGTSNLIPGLVTARHEGVPVIAVTSQHRAGIVYPATPATFQGQDQLDLLKPAVKWGAPIFEWTRIPELVRMAYREMFAGRPGPVHLEVPGTTLYAEADASTASIFPHETGRAGPPQASDAQLEAAAQKLAGAKTPVIFAGTGVDRAWANSALIALAEQLGCPVIPSLAGRSVIAHDHPLCFLSQSPAADELRRKADVLLVVGSRVGNLDVPFDKYWGEAAGREVIQIDVDPRHIGVSRPVTLGIVADARTALEGLARKLHDRAIASHGRDDLPTLRATYGAWVQALRDQVAAWSGPGIHPAQACAVVGDVFGRDAVYAADGGMTSLWASMALPSTRPSSYHSIFELGMLGTGIPSAIGAKLGAPGREVVCVTGDGAAGFNVMELQVAARDGIKVTVVVMAEGEWTMEIPNEMARYGQTFGTKMGEVRWDIVAQGLGCHGEIVQSIAELPAALERAQHSDRPALVCVRTSTEANLAVPQEIVGRFFEVYFGPAA